MTRIFVRSQSSSLNGLSILLYRCSGPLRQEAVDESGVSSYSSVWKRSSRSSNASGMYDMSIVMERVSLWRESD